MKKLFLLRPCLSHFYNVRAAIICSVATTAGNLAANASNCLNNVTNLTITGTIDARDFKIMRDNMPKLTVLNLNGVSIADYTGIAGTGGTSSIAYPANEMPQYGFCTPENLGKVTLKSIVMPSSTTSIGSSAFRGCTGLISVTIPTPVFVIECYAFSGCSGLKSVTLSASVTSIAEHVFSNCRNLTSVVIPASATSIESSAFSGCTALTSVTIPRSVTLISDQAFYSCSSLISVNIPSSVLSIGNSVFSDCNSLTAITIPASVTSIGDNAFLKNTGFITVDTDNPNYSSDDGVLFNKTKTRLIQCPIYKTGSYIIPASVTAIDFFAFGYCSGLTTVSIPTSLTSIGSYAFYKCTGLTAFTIPISVISIGSYALHSCTGLSSIIANLATPLELNSEKNNFTIFEGIDKPNCILFVPAGSKSAYAAADEWKDYMPDIVELTITGTHSLKCAGRQI